MKKFLSLMGTALVFSSYAYAQSPEAEKAIDIPDPLYQYISSGARYPEQFVSQVLMQIRQNGRDPNFIDQTDIDNAKEKRVREERLRQFQNYMQYDMNFDGQITRAEITEVFQNRSKLNDANPDISAHVENQIVNLMKADSNGDGVISLSEMSTLDEKKSSRRLQRIEGFEDLLKLDPNKDGKLTVQELETLAREVFNKIDANKDGIASPEEVKPLMKTRQDKINVRYRTENCNIPAANADEDVVFFGAYEGDTLTNISVAGQEEETNIIPVTIEKGTKKIFLVAASFSPVIWQISGDTSRISRVALAGPTTRSSTNNNISGTDIEKVSVGITGITKDKVTFHRAGDCGLSDAYGDRPKKLEQTKTTLKTIFGKEPGLIASQYSMLAAQVYDDKISLLDRSAIPASQKILPNVDKDAWENQLSYMPGGIINIEQSAVVSDTPAVTYEVLPKWAGIAQLLHSGALVPILRGNEGKDIIVVENGIQKNPQERRYQLRTVNDLKIVKDIPYYPSGLHGGYSVSFILGKGIKPPKGSAGHSCVISEETGKAIQNKMTCRNQDDE